MEVNNTSKGKLEYSIYGKGKPLLFIHGGHSSADEVLIHKHLNREKFVLITPSRLGYGGTELGSNSSPEEASRQLIELMDM